MKKQALMCMRGLCTAALILATACGGPPKAPATGQQHDTASPSPTCGGGPTDVSGVSDEATSCATLNWYINVMLCAAAAVPGGGEEEALSTAIVNVIKEKFAEEGTAVGAETVSELCESSSGFTNWSALASALKESASKTDFWKDVASKLTVGGALAAGGPIACAIAGTVSGVAAPVGFVCGAYVLAKATLCLSSAGYTYDGDLLGTASVCYVNSGHQAVQCTCSQRCVADPTESHGQLYGGWCIDASGAGYPHQPCLTGGGCYQSNTQTVQCFRPGLQSDIQNAGACENCGNQGQPACSTGSGNSGTQFCAPGFSLVGPDSIGRYTCNCPSPSNTCGGQCRTPASYQADNYNCGSCYNQCINGRTCQSGSCQCPSGKTSCYGGACTDLNTDRNNCGACGTSCSSSEICSGGTCQCPPGTTLCGGNCVDTNSDASNCGGCGNTCAGSNSYGSANMGVCIAGACSCNVPDNPNFANSTYCPSIGCVNLQTNTSNCGTCGNDCPSNAQCNAGQCACNSGYTLCGSSCRDLQADWVSCGSCDHTCNLGQTCQAGQCVGGSPSPSPSSSPSCGGYSQNCCPGDTCNGDNFCDTHDTPHRCTYPCGEQGQFCCGNTNHWCDSGLTCDGVYCQQPSPSPSATDMPTPPPSTSPSP